MTKTSNPIVFFGNEKLATGIKDVHPFIIEAVVAAGFTIEQHVTGSISELKPHKARLAVLAAYGHIIPASVLAQFPLGIINVHPSLLPQYRGSTPIEQALLDGVSKTGVSIMRLTDGMDEGPLYKQKMLHLSGKESKQELTEQLQKLGASLLQEVLPAIAQNTVQPRSQPHPSRATYTKRITKNDGVIDWQKPAAQLEREIRAYADWPKSTTILGDIEVVITKAQVVLPLHILEPGEILADKHELFVGTGDTMALSLLGIKPAGKAEMNISAFLAGYRDKLHVH